MYRQKGYKEDYYYFLMEFRRLGKIREWKVVGRNREANGESGSAHVEERSCAGRRRRRIGSRGYAGIMVGFFVVFFSFEFKTRNSV